MSEEEILKNDLRYIFELVRVHKEFNAVPDKKQKGKKEKSNITTEEKFIDDIVI